MKRLLYWEKKELADIGKAKTVDRVHIMKSLNFNLQIPCQKIGGFYLPK
jgi:hypothetical protein